MPGEVGRVAGGPGLRAWQFLKPLREAGHDVRLMTLRNEDDYRHDVPPVVRHHLDDGFTYEALSVDFFSDPKLLIARHDDWRPDAVMGVGSVLPAQMAAQAAEVAGCPAWCDFFGDPLAELQARAAAEAVDGSAKADADRSHVGHMMMRVLARADRLSTVSRRQEKAALGQLGLVGRLNRHNVGEDLTCVIPCGVDVDVAEHQDEQRGDGAFKVCLGGSFNTWMDVETLLDGLESAMSREARIRVEVTGGATPGYSERMYARFVERIESAGLSARVTLHGWLPNEAVASIHAGCNVGLNVDRWTTEGVFGSRNRLIQWLNLGLPVLTTPLTEVAEDIAAAGGALTFPVGDSSALSDTLVGAANDPDGLRASMERGRAFVREQYNLTYTLKAALEWAEAPSLAPDRETLGPGVPLNSLHESFAGM